MSTPGRIVAQIGLETTPGTPVTPTLALPIIGDGFTVEPTQHQADLRLNWAFPSRGRSIPVGHTVRGSFRSFLNLQTARDVINLACKRTSGNLSSFTILENQYGLGVAQYSGMVSRLSLEMSRSGSPDAGAILQATVDWEGWRGENAQGTLQVLTPPDDKAFHLRHSTVKINNVSYPDWLSMRLSIFNEIGLGPPDSSNKRLFMISGEETVEVEHTIRMASTSLRTLIEAGTDAVTNDIVAGTGTANETITFAIGKAQIEGLPRSAQDGYMVVSPSLRPMHTGSVHQLVATFGSSVPTSIIGL